MSVNIKIEFGKLIREARDEKGISRAILATRLNISPKTIQSWEMGRTFIERLDLIPRIEAELECSLSTLMAKATTINLKNKQQIADNLGEEENIYKNIVKPGPVTINVNICQNNSDVNELENDWCAVPLIKTAALIKDIVKLEPKDYIKQVLIPKEWATKSSILLATRMNDSAMMPAIPLGANVIIDRTALKLEKSIGSFAIVYFEGKGVKIRKIVKEANNKYLASAAIEHSRASRQIKEEKGDRLLGKVVAVISKLS